ncbi:hypothetical protein [Paenibacillus sp. J22TS3]|uniref:hypothetical protein n=1 Tax=Paenibacillus sp. J22TS3 TaxID=2807192 RepID=UPI001B189F96|nr:hypothetical protein [Paenibacillus sp. J22TS3]GIP23201.1 hypothetical protein J22TS3_34760 [Paenibacillus sp. J22TS3]
MRIGNIPDIQNFKMLLDQSREKGLITAWELPYEQLLTRLQAAIFFFNSASQDVPSELYSLFAEYPGLTIQRNEGTMSSMDYQISFQ